MKLLHSLLWVVVGASVAMAQPVLIEPPDFSNSFPTGSPDPAATHPGQGCFWLASGEMVPGDVDWIQLLIPFDTDEVMVDVDITSGSGSSHLFVSSSSGSSSSNNDDNDSAFDLNCGGGGLTTDSVVRLGTTPAGAIFGIGISGGSDAGFTGNHSETFNYDVHVHTMGTPPGCTQNADCNDGVGCTVDVCDLTSGECSVTPDDTVCDDGVGCTNDACDLVNDCQFVVDNSLCDDGVRCTVDTCDTTSDCQHVPNDAACDDAVGCTTDVCDVVNDCTFVPDHSACDDGVGCTNDACDLVNDCQFVADNSLCDDGVGCTVDTCDTASDCQHVPDDAACDDAVGCTTDVCDVVNDCTHVPDHSACDDGVSCTNDTCDLVNDCQLVADNSLCDDGVGCTVDTCDAASDCQHQSDDALCDNGLFCDGEEICDVVNDCQNGPNPCFPSDTCDETNGCQPTVGLPVEIDINPGRCPNRLNRFKRGFIRVALTGTSQLSPADVDRSSLLLTRADGVGQSLAPFVGSVGMKFKEDDVIELSGFQPCVCHRTMTDGMLDLLIPFESVAARDAFMFDAMQPLRTIELVLTGSTVSGDSFAASDCVFLIPPAKAKQGRPR